HVIATGALQGGEDVRADWAVGVLDSDWAFQDGLESLPDIKTLGLATDEDRYRLEVARRLACRLGRPDTRVLRRDGGVVCSCRGIELWLQFGFGSGPLRLNLGGPGGGLCFGILCLLYCLGRPCGGDRAVGCGQLGLSSELEGFRRADRHRRPRGLSGSRHG